ncbi:DNA cytosine methyltransferase [Candidatus Binatus sp.]|uniref:DNA cytosine methyltransferase n=1 Tax=Candidatus Binatus sp. TaxID=2811406 RepID=UPI003CC5FA8B
MRVADLFCGCGGISAGFQAANHEIVFAAENWSRARLVYDRNFDHGSTRLDLTDIVEAAFAVSRERPEVIAGGPPCQEFSAAGPRTEAARADLTVGFAEIVRACRPTWFVMENVPAAAASKAWGTARVRLNRAGYGITEVVLDASLYGVPQLRKRLFLIGRLDEDDGFLVDDLKTAGADRPLSVRGYLGDELGVEYYYRHPRHWGRRAIYSIDEPAATVRSTNRPIPPKYTSHPLDAAPIAGVKPLTARQRARLQTFGREFRFDRNLRAWEVDTMVANAVPVGLAQHLGEAMACYENPRNRESHEKEFRNWLQEMRSYTDRSAGNVISRLKRARRIVGVERRFADTRDELIALERMPEFAALSGSVRSQLKRAIILLSEFSHRS